MSGSPSGTGSSGGGGFVIRLVILLAFLFACVGIWVYDAQVRAPQISKEIDRFYNLMTIETDDGHGIPKDMVQEKTGLKPLESYTLGKYDVERYKISRTLPFMPGGAELFAVYQDKALRAIEIKRMTLEEMEEKYALKMNLNDWTGEGMRPNLPAAMGPGGASTPPPSAPKEDDKEDEGADKAAEEKAAEEKAAEEKAAEGDKADAAKEEGAKEGDGKETEGAKEDGAKEEGQTEEKKQEGDGQGGGN